MDILSLSAGRLRESAPLAPGETAAHVVATAVWAPSIHNTQSWWFSATRQEISLHADAGRQLTVAAALHSQPLERARLHEFIRTRLSDGSYPQLVLRFGTVIQTAGSVRRPPASVLLASGGEHLGISHG